MSSEVLPAHAAGSSAGAELRVEPWLAQLIGYVALLDVLFVPYFPLVIMPYSLPLVTGVLLCTARLRWTREIGWWLVLAVCVFASAALSALYRDQVTFLENTKRSFQLMSTFVYYFYFRWLAARSRLRLSGILGAFLAVFCAWLVFWTLDPARTAGWLAVLYPTSAFSSEADVFFRRFPYAFTDPNTAAYFLLVAGGFLVAYARKLSVVQLLLIGCAEVAAMIGTQSRGGMVALGVVLALALYYHRGAVLTSPVRVVVVGMIAVALVVTGWIWLSAQVGDHTPIGQLLRLLTTRLSGDHGAWQGGGGRTGKYEWVVTAHTLLPLGRGFLLLRDGSNFAPHSDHLRFLYSYGIVAWGIALGLLFRRVRGAYTFVVPAFVAFSINSLVDEQKLFALYLIALAVWTSSRQREETSEGDEPADRPARS